jgi:hypothetical protein
MFAPMTTDFSPPVLVSLKEALERRPWLNERWLRQAVYKKRIPYYKLGTKLLFDLADIDRYIVETRVPTAAEVRQTEQDDQTGQPVQNGRNRAALPGSGLSLRHSGRRKT